MKKIQISGLNGKDTIYSTSVYRLTVQINENNLTKGGHFDLSKLQNLRVLDSGFLKTLRIKYCKTQKQMANIVQVPLRTWIGWESYHKFLPFKKLVRLCKRLNIPENDFYQLIENTQFTYGNHHGKNRFTLPVDPDKFDLYKYMVPNELKRTYLIKRTPIKIKKKIINKFSLDNHYFKKTGLVSLYPYLLHDFLIKFFTYEKEILINFPLTSEIESLKKDGVNLKKAVLIPFALTDGGEKPGNRLYISGASEIVHKLWTDCMKEAYGILPSSFMTKHRSIMVTTHIASQEIISEFKKLCINLKTSPYKEKKQGYL